MRLLERFRVREYWLVDPIAERIEMYSLEDKHYVLVQLAGGDDPLESRLLGSLGGRARELFRSPI
jgi:Uma2 family endonuclease